MKFFKSLAVLTFFASFALIAQSNYGTTPMNQNTAPTDWNSSSITPSTQPSSATKKLNEQQREETNSFRNQSSPTVTPTIPQPLNTTPTGVTTPATGSP